MNLDELDAYLSSEKAPPECMMLPELDGFLTGIVVGPDFVPPSEWLPEVWGGTAPEFADTTQARVVLGTIMERYTDIVCQIADDACSPILLRNHETGTVSAADWAFGFAEAMALRPRSWLEMVDSEAGLLLVPIMVLSDAGSLNWLELNSDEGQSLQEAIDTLPETVLAIAEYRNMVAAREKLANERTAAAGCGK